MSMKLGKVVGQKNGYVIREVYACDADGNLTLRGYAVQSPDGNTMKEFSTFEEAQDYLDEVANTNVSTPRPKL